MTGRIFEIKRFAVHDGDGVRTTVFFKGCPLRCRWCHNPEGLRPGTELALFAHLCKGCGSCAEVCGSGAHVFSGQGHGIDREKCTFCGKCEKACPDDALKIYGREITVGGLVPILLEDREFYDVSGGGVTLSGGECLLQADFCAELLEKLKEEGISTAVDTCGYVKREELEKVIPFTDVFLYDIKAADSGVHESLTGVPNGLILDNLRYLDGVGAKTEIRIPLVPGLNDGEIPAIAEILRPLENVTGVRVLPYHDMAAAKYRALGLTPDTSARIPTEEDLNAAREILTARASGNTVFLK